MVFVRKGKEEQADLTIAGILGKKEKKGLVGIEIEVEGRRVPADAPAPWIPHRDGSLRGPENMEYVLEEPIAFEAVDKALDDLWAKFKTSRTEFELSNRTSVHVHLNVMPFYMNRVTNLMALWYIFEDILCHWCGEYRVGNLFCLRVKDAPGVIRSMRRFIENGGHTKLPENLHYAALNAHSIQKYGSLEFRPLRGTDDPNVIKTWVSILQRLYDMSAAWQDPREIVETFSLDGAQQFFHNTLGGLADEIRKSIPLTEDQMRDSMHEGMRFAQEICYARDWAHFNPIKVELDPFGRKTKVKKMTIVDEVEAAAPQPIWRAEPEDEIRIPVEEAFARFRRAPRRVDPWANPGAWIRNEE